MRNGEIGKREIKRAIVCVERNCVYSEKVYMFRGANETGFIQNKT